MNDLDEAKKKLTKEGLRQGMGLTPYAKGGGFAAGMDDWIKNDRANSLRMAQDRPNAPGDPDEPGPMYNTFAARDEARQGIRTATGVGQKVGAGLRGIGTIYGGVAKDVGRTFNSIRGGVAAASGDVMDGFNGGQEQRGGQELTPPAPAPAAQEQPSLQSARPGLAAAADPRQAYIEQSNAKMGLPIEDQRGAIDMSRQGIRGANAAQATAQGNPAYNLGNYGGDATFYGRAKPGSNRVTEFTATGTGQDDGGARQAMLTQQSIDRMNRSSELQRENAGLRQGLNDQGSGYLQPGGGASLGGGGFGGAVTAATMNARNNREGNRIADTNNQRTTDVSLANGLRTAATAQRQAEWERTKMGVEQGNKDREFGLRTQEFARAGEQQGFAQKETREKSIQAKLEAQNMIEGDDGKPTIDVNAVRAQRVGIDRAVARLGAKGVHEVPPMLEQQLIAGSKLLAKVQADGSNLNPFKPDFLKTMDPLDLINMRRLPNGDAQLTTNGQIIPKRYIEKVMSEMVLPGTPTNEFDILFQKAK